MKDKDEYVYAGIKTFMGSPYVSLAEASNYDVVVAGVPIDFGSSYRLGSKHGPEAIRKHSFMDRIASGKYYDLDTRQWLQGNKLSICDIGDIEVWPTDPNKNNEELQRVVTQISRTSFPIILGGDHSITYANFMAIRNTIGSDKRLGLLHFDAHLDTDDTYLPTLPEVWHGNVFRKLISSNMLQGNQMVTIGVRGRIGESTYRYTTEQGIKIITAADVKNQGVTDTMKVAIDSLRKSADYIFVSIDIDCLDITQAPGTGTPKYGGLGGDELVQALIQLREAPVIGMDLVEVNPQFDNSEITAILAGELLYNYLSFGFNKGTHIKLKNI